VTDRVNETRRKAENDLALQELLSRVDDWKGHDITTFGSLLLEAMFPVIKNESEREYHVYLFERIILCCKEATEPGGGKKKDKMKKESIIKKPEKKPLSKLQLKGRIFINNVLNAAPLLGNGKRYKLVSVLCGMLTKGTIRKVNIYCKSRGAETWARRISASIVAQKKYSASGKSR
jgi:hypothetical protein